MEWEGLRSATAREDTVVQGGSREPRPSSLSLRSSYEGWPDFESGLVIGLPFVARASERRRANDLSCGALAGGFARLKCEGCGHEKLVPFSCKGRGLCPSCSGRRMTESAIDQVENIIPIVPVRQWVLRLPFLLRYRMNAPTSDEVKAVTRDIRPPPRTTAG